LDLVRVLLIVVLFVGLRELFFTAGLDQIALYADPIGLLSKRKKCLAARLTSDRVCGRA
jgi:hypothetical protein